MTSRYIKVKLEAVLPVPPEVTDDLDAVAEAGLSALREHIAAIMTTVVPGTIHTSWQSMPQSWRPKQQKHIIVEEEVSPGFSHLIDSEEGISFVDLTGMPDPVPDVRVIPPAPAPPPKKELPE
jgi:hypothetical protein